MDNVWKFVVGTTSEVSWHIGCEVREKKRSQGQYWGFGLRNWKDREGQEDGRR